MREIITMVLTNGFISDPRVYKEAKYLVQKGFEVRVLCWDREGLGQAIDKIDEIKVFRFSHLSEYGSGPLKQLKAYIKFILDVKKFIKKNATHYIHFHDLDSSILSLIISKKKTKFILDMHEQYDRIYKGYKRKLIKLLLTLISKRMDKFIVVNEIQIIDYKSLYNSKPVHILKNLPESRIFNNVKKIESERVTISFIGSVRDEKSLAALIEAFKGDKEFQINIIGSGIAQKKLYQNYKNIPNVLFVNGYNYKNIVKYYNKSDLIYAAYNPNNENYRMAIPVKVYEALYCGIPVIVSKGTEVEKFVQELEFGIAVEYAKPGEIKLEILKVFNENKKKWNYLSANALKSKENYTWEKEVTILDEIYNP